MKIRTDFVTNSSSSSFIGIRIEDRDGKKYEGTLNNDNTGYGEVCTFKFLTDAIAKASSGKEFFDLFMDEFNSCTDDDPANEFEIKNLGDLASFENIKMIEVEEDFSCDDCGFNNVFKYDVDKNEIYLTSEDPWYCEEDEDEDGEFDDECKTLVIESVYDLASKKEEIIKKYTID